jgi:hypothetical protein
MTKKIIKILSAQESNVLDIRFWPTDICNYNCSYCFPGSKDGVYRFPKNIDTIIKNFRKLFDVYKEKYGKNKYRINLVGGGEPTMWPYFSKFCEEIKKHHDVRLQVTTNGSRTLRWWEENYHYLDKAVLSCHHEFVDLEHYIAVADFLFSKGLIVDGLVLMDASNWDRCVEIVETMKKTSQYPWIIETKTVVDSPGRDINSYTDQQLNYLKSSLKRIPDSDWLLSRIDILNPFKSVAIYEDESIRSFKPDEYISNKVNNFFNWTCHVSLENLVITYDGTVSGSCHEEIFKNVKLNIFSETFDQDFDQAALNLSPIKCPKLLCSCTPDTHITKYRS